VLADFVQHRIFTNRQELHKSVSYVKGVTVQIEDQWLEIKGHDPENLVLGRFPNLWKLRGPKLGGKAGALSFAIINQVITALPGFCPSVLAEMFQTLSNMPD
jgi:hypothetical protein